MRWITKKQRMYNIYWYFFCIDRGYYYTNKFLWFPMELNGEVRWLCKAKIQWKIQSDKDLFNKTYYFWEAYNFKN
jgi:hypothetical protein